MHIMRDQKVEYPKPRDMKLMHPRHPAPSPDE